jgi:hypothetical protein
MLSFEFKRSSLQDQIDELEIYCDRPGLESLVAQLRLLAEGHTEHVHLMAPEWGGTHLDDSPQVPEQIPIRHVKILLLRSASNS